MRYKVGDQVVLNDRAVHTIYQVVKNHNCYYPVGGMLYFNDAMIDHEATAKLHADEKRKNGTLPVVSSDDYACGYTDIQKGITELERRVIAHKEICETMNQLYELKNRKYGDSFAEMYQSYKEEFGTDKASIQICIRLEDKLRRLKQLLLNCEAETDDESVLDTLQDMANYAIMSMMILEGDE